MNRWKTDIKQFHFLNALPEKSFQIFSAAPGPWNISKILPFDPFSRHDMKTICTRWVVIVMIYSHAKNVKVLKIALILREKKMLETF